MERDVPSHVPVGRGYLHLVIFMQSDDDNLRDLSPSDKPLLESGPCRVPVVSNTSGIPFFNWRFIIGKE